MGSRTRRRPGNPAARPTQDGLPVPWVARWSGERPRTLTRPRVEQRPGPDLISLIPTLVADNAVRDRYGIVWLDMEQAPGSGRAGFAALHPLRQRACMDEGRCQVCGVRIRPPVTFLLPRSWVQDSGGVMLDDVQVSHAPVCARCAPAALGFCPYVRGDEFVLVAAGRARPYAVLGDVYDLTSGRRALTITAAHDDPRCRLLVARQRLARISDLQLRP